MLFLMMSLSACHRSILIAYSRLFLLLDAERYDIFNFFVQEYHRRLYTLFVGFGELIGNQLAPADIILLGKTSIYGIELFIYLVYLVQWVVSDYGVLMGRLGVVESELHPPLLEALEPMFSVYTKHVRVFELVIIYGITYLLYYRILWMNGPFESSNKTATILLMLWKDNTKLWRPSIFLKVLLHNLIS